MVPFQQIQAVLKAVNPRELIDLASQLIRINSVFDPAAGTNETEAALAVARWAEAEGFQVEVEEAAPGRPNVIITYSPSPGPPCLILEAHTDVVTPGDPTRWRRDPFGAQIVGRTMYGRGSNDTKGNLAAMLVALAAIKRSEAPVRGTLIGAVLCDEEGGMLGVRDFIARGRADRVSAAIICEPQDGLICCTQKGAIRARYSVSGRMAHGAMPLSGLNTAPGLARLIEGLTALEREAAAVCGRDEYLGWPSFTPTVIRAPAAGAPQLNVMPGESELLVDVRTIPAQSHDQVRADLETLAVRVETEVNQARLEADRFLGLERPADLRVRVEFLTDRPCTLTDRDEPVVKAVDWATRLISGRQPVYAGVAGATDGTFLWSMKNIPIVTIGAGDRQVPHQVDEWVDLDQLIATAKIFAASAAAYLWPGQGSDGEAA